MLMVPCELRRSEINGVGVFATTDIPAGALVWRFNATVDQLIPFEKLNALPEPARSFMLSHAYESTKRPGMWVLCGDQMGYQNHSRFPNCSDLIQDGPMENDTIALRRILAGEELLGDYLHFDANAHSKPFVRDNA